MSREPASLEGEPERGLWPARGSAARALVLGATAVNLVASILMGTVMRGATGAGGDVAARVAFIAEHATGVSIGWWSWVLATLGLLVVIASVLRSLETSRLRGLRPAALGALAVGSVPDLVNNLVGAAILPVLARRIVALAPGEPLRLALETDFELWDRFSVLLTGALANSLYAAALALTTWIALRTDGFPRWLAWLGVPLSVTTALIAVAAVADSVPLLVLSVGITMATFCLWATGIAWLWLGRPALSRSEPERGG